ncbi:flagellar biosynthesis protein FliQ [Breoghania sp. L-A4]|uniref:flagellar biosynthesis protein FliQ n=1 Tax=Breoghania sp. L-A4 TaxID=2304600 RepID=UPI000E35A08D|nr:flagellar biosynthesis protein FliQ [Breoghania sp. L-A4]AXS41199.1 flagellar biosynthetic protein FliQ [Breoghania sp. L-A4]
MTGAEVLDIGREAIWTLLYVVAPTMIVGLVVGVTIALVQALTQVQEMTLVFVPKILAIFIALLLTLPLMGQVMNAFMIRVVGLIAQT